MSSTNKIISTIALIYITISLSFSIFNTVFNDPYFINQAEESVVISQAKESLVINQAQELDDYRYILSKNYQSSAKEGGDGGDGGIVLSSSRPKERENYGGSGSGSGSSINYRSSMKEGRNGGIALNSSPPKGSKSNGNDSDSGSYQSLGKTNKDGGIALNSSLPKESKSNGGSGNRNGNSGSISSSISNDRSLNKANGDPGITLNSSPPKKRKSNNGSDTFQREPGSNQEVEKLQKSSPTHKAGNINVEDKKICVMHVGPHKTASTSLQEVIFNGNTFKDALKEDNYRVPVFNAHKLPKPTKNHAALAHCFLQVEDEKNSFCPSTARIEIMSHFQSFMNAAKSEGTNILFTSEAFDFPSFNITAFTSYLMPEFKIHVVVYYRRFYDWLYSTYNQQMKRRANKGKDFPMYHEWLQRKSAKVESKYTKGVYDRFEKVPGVFNVSVVNLHQSSVKSNPLETFFCDHVDQANHACNTAKSFETSKQNPSKDLDWLRLRSKISLHHTIKLEPQDKRWKEIKKKFVGAPRLCLSDDLKKWLLKSSLEYETAVTPEWWHNSKEGLEDLKRDFEEKINSKHCAVDVPGLLTSTEWQRFLTELERQS